MTLSNLRKTLQQLQPVLHNKKLNVGVVKEQVGVAFTYPHGFWNLLATAVRITEGLLYQAQNMFVTNMGESRLL